MSKVSVTAIKFISAEVNQPLIVDVDCFVFDPAHKNVTFTLTRGGHPYGTAEDHPVTTGSNLVNLAPIPDIGTDFEVFAFGGLGQTQSVKFPVTATAVSSSDGDDGDDDNILNQGFIPITSVGSGDNGPVGPLDGNGGHRFSVVVSLAFPNTLDYKIDLRFGFCWNGNHESSVIKDLEQFARLSLIHVHQTLTVPALHDTAVFKDFVLPVSPKDFPDWTFLVLASPQPKQDIGQDVPTLAGTPLICPVVLNCNPS